MLLGKISEEKSKKCLSLLGQLTPAHTAWELLVTMKSREACKNRHQLIALGVTVR